MNAVADDAYQEQEWASYQSCQGEADTVGEENVGDASTVGQWEQKQVGSDKTSGDYKGDWEENQRLNLWETLTGQLVTLEFGGPSSVRVLGHTEEYWVKKQDQR